MKILRIFGFVVLILIACITGWAVWYSMDEGLNPEIATYFPDDPFDPEDNFYVAWSGLHAPAGTKDIYDYGLKLINREIEWDRENALEFQGETEFLECWKGQQWREWAQDENKPCANAKEIRAMYDKNRELIGRYRTFYTYGNHNPGDKAGFVSPGAKGQDLISMHHLFAARWSVLAETGQGETAMREWIADTRFLQKVFPEKHTMVDHAIWMVIYGQNIAMLPVMLERDPTLVSKWSGGLEKILKMNMASPDIWHNVMRGEYYFLKLGLDFAARDQLAVVILKPNSTWNAFYGWANGMVWLAAQSPTALKENADTVISQCTMQDKSLVAFFLNKNFLRDLIMDGICGGTKMMQNTHKINARSRALILYMRAQNKNIPPENMADFLQDADSSLYDPFTEKPFQWDAQEKSVYFAPVQGSRVDLYYTFEK